ncbi:MAG: glycosyltransferase [Candidatus Vogelbacteria bacterium]|nr:glycosyltransferase [Candidatus Vogelbacteria bacterium]
MNLVFVANNRLPTEKAHGWQIAKTCEALAVNGVKVTLITPKVKRYEEVDLHQYYRLESNFNNIALSVPYLLNLGIIGFSLRSLWLGVKTSWWIREQKIDFIYSRDLLTLMICRLFGYKTVWEAHDVRHRLITYFGLKFTAGLVVITNGLKQVYNDHFSYFKKILVAADGVEVSDFDLKLTKSEARAKLGLPLNKQLIVYTGHLYSWKGVDTLAEATKQLTDNQLVVLVGGTEVDLKRFKSAQTNNDRILICGHQPHHLIPFYLQAADVLVLPNSGREAISKYYTSPLKLFEYMASNRPIIASDLPSIREILDNDNAFLVPADEVTILANAIKQTLENEDLARAKASKAKLDVTNYTWDKRAERIKRYLQTL